MLRANAWRHLTDHQLRRRVELAKLVAKCFLSKHEKFACLPRWFLVNFVWFCSGKKQCLSVTGCRVHGNFLNEQGFLVYANHVVNNHCTNLLKVWKTLCSALYPQNVDLFNLSINIFTQGPVFSFERKRKATEEFILVVERYRAPSLVKCRETEADVIHRPVGTTDEQQQTSTDPGLQERWMQWRSGGTNGFISNQISSPFGFCLKGGE